MGESVVNPGDALHLPAAPAGDHATLALLPLTVASASSDLSPVTRTYWVTVDGKQRRISLTLEPGSEGLPTHEDGMVYLALLQLALRTHDGEEAPGRLEFRRQEVFELLQWRSEGWSYDRLKTALRRLHLLSIQTEEALVARTGREYARTTEASHIIGRFHLTNKPNGTCWVEWGGLVDEAFVLGDFKRLDWDLVLALKNPLTAQLYRLLDRVTLSGEQEWQVGWKPLAEALGMSTGYNRPAKLRDKLKPHIDALIEQEVLDGYEYQRGGTFVFHVQNKLRAQLREVLTGLGVYPEAARQLVAGHDEVAIICQVDCLQHGNRSKPREPAAFLYKAIQDEYPLSYADDEKDRFQALWDLLEPGERADLHQRGLQLLGSENDLFDTNEDPTAWRQELRCVCRFLATQA